MKRVAFYTLGCKLNFSETSTLSRRFEEQGFIKVDFTNSPDIFIINTCSVTDNADKKCRKVVREALAISPDAIVALTGCYAQLKPKEIAKIPGVAAIFGAAEKFLLPEKISELINRTSKPNRNKPAFIYNTPIEEVYEFHHSFSIHDRTRTFLKVQDGCNYSCTFCTIPLARGKSRSDSIENLIKVTREIANTDVKEVVLTGVNTGDFGWRNGKKEEKFIGLIRELDEIDGIERFRISSIEPNLLDEEIIEFVAGSKKFVPHFHIPLQSGSDDILKKMKRRYLTALYQDRVELIKKYMPHCCIGVDVIVGFPGETDSHFLETYNFLNELDISYLHVFNYSVRDNTPAQKMSGKVVPQVRQERSAMLRNLSQKKRSQFYSSQVGEIRSVLFENDVEDGKMHGFTENYIKTSASYNPELINEILMVKLDYINSRGVMEIAELNSVPQL